LGRLSPDTVPQPRLPSGVGRCVRPAGSQLWLARCTSTPRRDTHSQEITERSRRGHRRNGRPPVSSPTIESPSGDCRGRRCGLPATRASVTRGSTHLAPSAEPLATGTLERSLPGRLASARECRLEAPRRSGLASAHRRFSAVRAAHPGGCLDGGRLTVEWISWTSCAALIVDSRSSGHHLLLRPESQGVTRLPGTGRWRVSRLWLSRLMCSWRSFV
jgi:hypothetical protein